MDPFELPAELPTDVAGLTALRDDAQAYVAFLLGRVDAGETLSADEIGYITCATEAIEELNGEIASLATADDAISRARTATAAADTDEDESDEDETEEEEDEAEAESEELATVGANGGGTPRPKRTFRGRGPREDPDAGGDLANPEAPRWRVMQNAPGFADNQFGTQVGFAQMGAALDAVTVGRGGGRFRSRGSKEFGSKMRQGIAQLSRGLPMADTDRELVEAINKMTTTINGGRITTEALTAAGGWCAPSEQIYTFCDIPDASDLITLPEIVINRGGLRWPVEPDLTSIFESFEFFFTEPQLEAVDGGGNPTAIKHCVEIPCPSDFEEIRLNAVGYCVEAGILQRQGWPESIEWFLRALTQEHMRAMSRRTILDMWNGGGAPSVFDATLQVGGTSSVLNSLDLAATNLRLNKGYARNYPIEIVAPSWFFAALRADMAMMEGLDTKFVTDATVTSWLSARNIVGQFVGDWQTRDTTLPGHLDTLRWPGHVDVMMYPAGTWFRHLAPIIEVGVLYPKEQLVINRYTEFFTEDAIAVGKKCDRSLNLRIPLLINGGCGARYSLSYSDTTPDLGTDFPDPTQPPGGQVDVPLTKSLATSGAPAGGSFKIEIQGEKTATIDHVATAANVLAAIVALDDEYGDILTITGGALGTNPVVIAGIPSGWDFQITDKALTGGTSPNVALT